MWIRLITDDTIREKWIILATILAFHVNQDSLYKYFRQYKRSGVYNVFSHKAKLLTSICFIVFVYSINASVYSRNHNLRLLFSIRSWHQVH